MDINEREEMLRTAAEIYRMSGLYSDEQLPDIVKTLDGQGLWSISQVAKIIGASPTKVRRYMTKTSKTGGRFDPATLPLILEEIELAKTGESNPVLTAEIWRRGTSPGFLALLIEQPVATVQWRAARGRDLIEERDG